jgi:hypothetical protein
MTGNKDPTLAAPIHGFNMLPSLHFYVFKELLICQGIKPDTFKKIENKILKYLLSNALNLPRGPGLTKGKAKMALCMIPGRSQRPINKVT